MNHKGPSTAVEFPCCVCGVKRLYKKSIADKHVEGKTFKYCSRKHQFQHYKERKEFVENGKRTDFRVRKSTHPEWVENIRKGTKGKVNLGNSNGMKKPEAKAKVSKTRSKKFATDPEFKEMVAECTRQAWADGKYEGVNVGRCKWHDFIKKDGTVVRCQGTWELAYAKYLDAHDVQFTSHNAMSVKYIDENGVQRTYLPDFYLTETIEYVDVKSDYTTSLQPMKIDQVRASNPDLKLRVVGKNELVELGILNKGGLPII